MRNEGTCLLCSRTLFITFRIVDAFYRRNNINTITSKHLLYCLPNDLQLIAKLKRHLEKVCFNTTNTVNVSSRSPIRFASAKLLEAATLQGGNCLSTHIILNMASTVVKDLARGLHLP